MSESLYTMVDYEIPFKKYGDEITIVPISDVHAFAPMWSRQKFIEDCEEWAKMDNVYFLGMGDYIDLLSGSERRELDLNRVHESTESTLEDYYLKKTEEFCDMIKFTKGRIIGLIEGNHHVRFSFGGTSTQVMCQRLNCNYLGGASSISLLLRYSTDMRHVVDIFAHHGRSGGRMPSSSISPLYHTANGFDCDILLFGHDHNRSCDFITRIGKTRNAGKTKIHAKKILIARCGTYLKSYEPKRMSYAVKSVYPPTDLGSIKITLIPQRKHIINSDDRWVDIKCEI